MKKSEIETGVMNDTEWYHATRLKNDPDIKIQKSQDIDWGSQRELCNNGFSEVWDCYVRGCRIPRIYLKIMDIATSWEHARYLLKQEEKDE